MNTFDSIGFNFDMLCYTYKLRNNKSAFNCLATKIQKCLYVRLYRIPTVTMTVSVLNTSLG
jgi:hypothetical protein